MIYSGIPQKYQDHYHIELSHQLEVRLYSDMMRDFILYLWEKFMLKQTVYLFIRALIIGILLNVGLHQIAGAPLPQSDTIAPQQVQHSLDHSSANPEIDFSNQ
jgi:hypothetical protein